MEKDGMLFFSLDLFVFFLSQNATACFSENMRTS